VRPRARRGPAAVAEIPATPPPGGSVSVGRHNRGRLLFGAPLRESEHLRLRQPGSAEHHGTDELVGLLARVSHDVAAAHPGARLTVGDLSGPRGGRLRPHRSHRNGRDADVGFFVTDASGQPRAPEAFVAFRADGTSRRDPSLRFDDARNWTVVASLVGQADVPVQHVFVASGLRQRLLDHAARIGAPASLVERAALVMGQPRRGGRHDDHFHVRVYCAPDDRPRCEDEPPFHAWVPAPAPAERVAIRRSVARDRALRTRAARRARAARSARRSARPAADGPDRATPGG